MRNHKFPEMENFLRDRQVFEFPAYSLDTSQSSALVPLCHPSSPSAPRHCSAYSDTMSSVSTEDAGRRHVNLLADARLIPEIVHLLLAALEDFTFDFAAFPASILSSFNSPCTSNSTSPR